VMHDHHSTAAVAMRMGVFFRRTAVCRPARVPDAVGAVERLQPDHFFQVPELALRPPDLQTRAVARHRNPRRIVAAILQPLQSVQNHRYHPLLPDVPYDPAHGLAPCDGSLVFYVVTKFFNHWIGEYFPGDACDLVFRIRSAQPAIQADLEVLVLAYI